MGPAAAAKKRVDPLWVAKKEARRMGLLVYVPPDRGDGKRRFVPVQAIEGAMDHAVEVFGLDVIKKFYAQASAAGVLGRVTFDANRLPVLLSAVKAGDTLWEPQAVKNPA